MRKHDTHHSRGARARAGVLMNASLPSLAMALAIIVFPVPVNDTEDDDEESVMRALAGRAGRTAKLTTLCVPGGP